MQTTIENDEIKPFTWIGAQRKTFPIYKWYVERRDWIAREQSIRHVRNFLGVD
jgi:hypothetical protein